MVPLLAGSRRGLHVARPASLSRARTPDARPRTTRSPPPTHPADLAAAGRLWTLLHSASRTGLPRAWRAAARSPSACDELPRGASRRRRLRRARHAATETSRRTAVEAGGASMQRRALHSPAAFALRLRVAEGAAGDGFLLTALDVRRPLGSERVIGRPWASSVSAHDTAYGT